MPLRTKAAVVFGRSAGDTLSSKQHIRDTQAILLDPPEAETPVGLARRERDGLYQEVVNGEPVLWISDGAK